MLLNTKSIYYKDVNIISTKPSVINSRDDIALDNNRIIIAPMPSIIGKTFVASAINLGLSLPIHRFCSVIEQSDLLNHAIKTKKQFNSSSKLWLCVGLKDWQERIQQNYFLLKDNEVGVLIDTANGFSWAVDKACRAIMKKYQIFNLFTGNVHHVAGFSFLQDCGSSFIRVGLGGGSVCLTKDNTGCNRGQITEIDEIYNGSQVSAEIVADGGIKGPSEAAKAFGSGADYIMMGGYFARAKEAEANINGDGIYYGGASEKAKQMSSSNPKRYVEGTHKQLALNEIEPLEVLLRQLTDGVRSAISYAGYTSLKDYIGKAVFEAIV